MFNSHYSNFLWTELLFKLVTIPFLVLLLLLFGSQLIMLQHTHSVRPFIELRHPTHPSKDIVF
jgi:hypothetical protein